MFHGLLSIRRTVTAAFTAAVLIGGVGVISASAAPAKPTVHAQPQRVQEIVGYYQTYSNCNAAGAKGIREGKWINYLCEQIPPAKGWFLSVERGEKNINVRNAPSYRKNVNISITCASFSGKLGWGGGGVIVDYAFVELTEPYSFIEDTCNNGYARLYIHYDTVDNPKTIKVIQIDGHRGSETPFLNEDNINTYKDIYVYLCSESGGHYRCSGHVKA